MYFLDTYALIEIIRGNPAYEKFNAESCVTTSFNLMELYYALLRMFDLSTAEKYYALFQPLCMSVRDDLIKHAMRFRLQQRSERNLISYIDCIGYIVALDLGILFVTGEKHFSNLPSVEFI